MPTQESFYMPSAASTVAPDVDRLYSFIHGVSVFFFLLIVLLMTYFVIRYRRRSESDTTPDISHNTPLEIIWTIIPLVLVLVIFYWGFRSYLGMRVAPNNAITIYVTARQWVWQFEYPDKTIVPREFAVPVNEPVKLIMSSQDVIHSFFVPNFRVKQDVLPNRYTTLWFQATQVGDFPIYCTQYCGFGHSDMTGTVHVLPMDKYKEWIKTGGIDAAKMTLPEYGKLLFTNLTCSTCHTVDGSKKVGPSLKGIFGKAVTFADGASATVDENYIRESILNPNAKIVAGFAPGMPNLTKMIKDERQLNALVEYIKSLK